MNQITRRFLSRSAVASAAVVAMVFFAACGEVSTTPTSAGGVEAVSGETLTVTSGVRLERRVSGPGRLEFDMTNMHDGNTAAKRHLAWGYEPGQNFNGGRTGNGAEFGLRSYKMKVFGAGGHFISEPRYNIKWDRAKTYHVVIEWDAGRVSANIDGTIVGVGGSFPGDWIIGIGWPPAVRPGIDGLIISNIRWPSGSTKL